MSKLTVANLYHSLRELNAASGLSSRTAHLIGENLWRLTAKSDSAEGLIDLSDLMSAVHFVFEATEAEPSSRAGDFAAWRLQQSERQLRFDPEHRGRLNTHGFHGRFVPEPAGQALRKGLGEAQAREQLEQQHWIVIVVDAQAPSAAFPPELLQALHARQRILVLWCDEHSPDARPPEYRLPSAAAFEQLSADRDLMCLGPIGGLEMDGVVAVLEGLKALEKPAILHLRLRAAAQENETFSYDGLRLPSAIEPGGATRLERGGPAHLRISLLRAAERFSRRAAADRRMMGVNLLSEENALDLAAELVDCGFSRLEVHADSVNWCAGLADGGCRPCLLLDGAAVRRLWGSLAEMIGEASRPATLIIAPTANDLQPSATGLDGIDQLQLLPNLALLVPSDAAEFDRMLAATTDGPAAIFLPPHLADAPAVPLNEQAEFGRAALLRHGEEAALFAIGDGVPLAADAAAQLAQQGVRASVIDLRFVRPLDEQAVLRAVERASMAMLVTEGLAFRGFDAILSDLMARANQSDCIIAPCPPRRRISGDRHEHCELRSREIVERCLAVLQSTTRRNEPVVSTSAPHSDLLPPGSRVSNDEQAQIHAMRLSPAISTWVDEYSKLGQRGLYLWKWCLYGVGLTTLPCVLPSLRDDVCDTKLLSILLCVLLDDVADQHGSRELLEALVNPSGKRDRAELNGLSKQERAYADLTWRIWEDYFARVSRYPQFEAFSELLRYDLLQFCNTMRYSHLLNERLYLLNLAEHDLYSSHNMMMVSFATVDLMCSPGFPLNEIGRLREAMWHAQCMGRIGNLLSTWRREIADRDFTSGVFARAVMEGDLTVEQLMGSKPEQIEAAILNGKHVEFFIHRWHEHRECFRNRIRQIRSADLSPLLNGHERFLGMHVGSEGMI